MADDPRIARLRRRYKPGRVTTLLVGESAPAGGTHYYLANSDLFAAIRKAVGNRMENEPPQGAEFLRFAADLGIWLVDLATEPVNHLPRRERTILVRAGIGRVANIIRRSRPNRVVAVKMSLRGNVQEEVNRSGHDVRLFVVPFPGSGWQNVFVDELTQILSRPDP